jgi:hypothetical protein
LKISALGVFLAGAVVLSAPRLPAAMAAGQTAGPSAGAAVPVLVELFTSEGCSSCPPADRLLIDLLRTQPVAGALVIGLSEHVDYWNQLGWRDPFSDRLFSQRQSDYATAAKSNEIYTPQMIVDGGATFVGSDHVAALAAIARGAKAPKGPVSLGWASTSPRALTVSLSGATPGIGATVFLAIAEDGLSTSVRAGENSGHVLTHGAVTRRLTEIGRADRAGAFTRAGVPVDLDATWHTQSLHVVVFAAARDTRRVVAVGAIDVPPPGKAWSAAGQF